MSSTIRRDDTRILVLRFTVPADLNLTDDEIHDMGERIVTADQISSEPVTFDGTDVIDKA